MWNTLQVCVVTGGFGPPCGHRQACGDVSNESFVMSELAKLVRAYSHVGVGMANLCEEATVRI